MAGRLATLFALVGLALGLALSPAAARVTLKRGVNFEAWQTWTNRSAFLDAGYDRTNFPDWSAKVSDAQLTALRAQGFDFVRVNVDPSPMFWVGESGADALIERVIAATQRLQAAGFTVIVDLHLLPEMDDRPDGLHDVLGTGDREQRLFDAYVVLVGKVAGRLAQLPADRTALEPINEPDQDWFSHISLTDRWPAQLAALEGAARAAAPKLTLILPGGRSAGIDGLLRLDPAPFSGDPEIIWTFHYYEPMSITHAGQPWEETPARFLTHLPYPASAIDDAAATRLLKAADKTLAAVIADAGRRDDLKAGVAKALDDYRASGASPEAIAADFARVTDWANRNGITPDRILLGEFGAFQDQALPEARLAIFKATRQAAEAAGFSWAIYTAGLAKAHNSFGILEDTETLTVEPGVKDALGLAGN
ncbi:cellulase family glycosylhydrolase [Oryzibacter oryziterrae]|uniref:cellulase family glycosylhydrolase n=1 Tax=Oryzibacter oryziterrae TaxID=2766474 RepID=UPI001F394A92|nr:cellulase family glycosylhydrolase [Oryzibacter oryziterrae]